ncbi:MAG: DNA polymerase [Actinobacteria bacterium]|nr:DNA polymerase [Actinomycetota bacterium]MCL5446031.1 DNA polymerase [Actinomycetota bacterium]
MASHVADRTVRPGVRPVFLLDGSSLVFRAFYALPQDMATGGGLVTNAVYGFVSMVTNMLRDYRPDAMVMAFDRPEPTFRSEIVAGYKANRAETPEILLPQFELVRRFAQLLGVPQLDRAGYEADDILATLSTQAREAHRNVVVVTGDRDAFALVEDPYVKVMYTRKGISDVVVYDEAGIVDRTGVPPSLYPFMAALRGDPSDNLTGVAGVGEKTAARLATTYGDPDVLFSRLDELTPKLCASLSEAREQVMKNLEATLLVHGLDLGISIDAISLDGFDLAGLRSFLVNELEMRTAWNRLEAVLNDLGNGVGAVSKGYGTGRHGSGTSDGAGSGGDYAARSAGEGGGAGAEGGEAVGSMHASSGTDAGGVELSGTVSVLHADPIRYKLHVSHSANDPVALVALHSCIATANGADRSGTMLVSGVWRSANQAPAGAGSIQGVIEGGHGGASPGTGNAAGTVQDAGKGEAAGIVEDIGRDQVEVGGVPSGALGNGPESALSGIVLGTWLPTLPVCSFVYIEMTMLPAMVSQGTLQPAGFRLLEDTRNSAAGGASEGAGGGLVTSGARALMRALLARGVDLRDLRMDCEIAGYLLDPGTGHYSLDDLCDKYLGGKPEMIAVAGREETPVDGDHAVTAAVNDALCSGLLCGLLERMLVQEGMSRLYNEIELPLAGVLACMEHAGIAVDRSRMEEISRDLIGRAAELAERVQEIAGVRFNVNSTKDLREILYGESHLHLKPGRKTKTGYSTDARTLEKLRTAHPMVEALLEYREVEKLRSTYGERLQQAIAGDGRIHATFRQTATRTGRLASDRPNLHNIPVRTDIGRQIREAFIPADGCYFIVADYDQIELRIIAHLANDPGLLAAFEEGRDVHAEIAARVYAVPSAQVTTVQRNRAKMVSYGLAYGMETFGLADRLAITNAEAQAILDAYFSAFPGLHAYMERAVMDARRQGYTTTLMGRRRPLPELRSLNRVVRQAAERQAMNAGVQGLAADLFKLALVRLARSLQDVSSLSRIVLQVHDEVLIEAHPADGSLQDMVRSVLVGVGDEVGLSVPLKVSIGTGGSWAAAKHG